MDPHWVIPLNQLSALYLDKVYLTDHSLDTLDTSIILIYEKSSGIVTI